MNLPLHNNVIERLKTTLSHHEIQRAKQFHFETDKKGFIATRGVLRELIASYLNIYPQEVRFDFTPYGKPYLKKSTLQFNISHTKNCVVLAFTYHIPIGIDIEYCKKELDFLSLAQEFCSNNEYKKLLSLPLEKRYLEFYRCWTRKEAILKAFGTGFSFPPKELEVSLLPFEEAKIIHLQEHTSEKNDWHLVEINPIEGYIGAIAAPKKLDTISLLNWN